MQIHWEKMTRYITDDLENFSDNSDESKESNFGKYLLGLLLIGSNAD